MNERIKQLLYEHRIYDGRCGETQGIMTCAKTLNEFAQSIVLESSKWMIDNGTAEWRKDDLSPEFFARGLLKHFGVEE